MARQTYVEIGPIIPRKEVPSGRGDLLHYTYTRNIVGEEAQIRAICEDIQLLADILYNEYGITDVRQHMLDIREGLSAYGELVGTHNDRFKRGDI